MPTFDTAAPISATIDLAVGDVRISAGDRATTVVVVQPTDASNADDCKVAEQTRVEYANHELLIKAPKLRSWLSRNGGPSIDVTVELPAGSHVHGSVGMGDVHADGRLGDCRIKSGVGRIRLDEAAKLELKTGAGDVSVDRATGHSEVAAGHGDVRLRELDDTAVIKNSNGDIRVGVAHGDVRLSTANGKIAVDVAHASVDAKSAAGDITVSEVAVGTIALQTHLGNLEVGIPAGTAAWLDVSSRFGRVSNALDASDAPASSDATLEVRARASVGDVVIKRP